MMPGELQRAVETALELTEAVDEPWLTRHVAQSLATMSTVRTTKLHSHDGDPDVLLLDRADETRWVRSDTYYQTSTLR